MLPNDLRTLLRPQVGAVLKTGLPTPSGLIPAGRFVALELVGGRGAERVAVYRTDGLEPVAELAIVDAAALCRLPTADDERGELTRLYAARGSRRVAL